MDFIESLSFPFYCTDLHTACMPARADAIYVFFSDEKRKVCELSLLLAVGSHLSLRCIRGLDTLEGQSTSGPCKKLSSASCYLQPARVGQHFQTGTI